MLGCSCTQFMEDFMRLPAKHITDRRSFLGSIATGSAALAITAAGLHGSAPEASGESADAALGFSEAWLGKLTGKHKQFFDATSTNQFVLVFAMNFLNSYNDAYKIPAEVTGRSAPRPWWRSPEARASRQWTPANRDGLA